LTGTGGAQPALAGEKIGRLRPTQACVCLPETGTGSHQAGTTKSFATASALGKPRPASERLGVPQLNCVGVGFLQPRSSIFVTAAQLPTHVHLPPVYSTPKDPERTWGCSRHIRRNPTRPKPPPTAAQSTEARATHPKQKVVRRVEVLRDLLQLGRRARAASGAACDVLAAQLGFNGRFETDT
jgi:hypothetical protein